ncbi:hypothetical protein Hanom_Chr14g01257301 [Helianthus anomalus]
MLQISKRGSNNHNMKRDKKSRNRNGDSQVNCCSSGAPTNGVWLNGLSSTKPQNNGLPCNVQPFIQQGFIQNLGVPSLPHFNPQFNTSIGHVFPCDFVQVVHPNLGAYAFWPQNNSASHKFGHQWAYHKGLLQSPKGLVV